MDNSGYLLSLCSRPVFVIGAPRSGTSAIGWALHEHSSFVAGGESGIFLFLLRQLENYFSHHYYDGLWLQNHRLSLADVLPYFGLGVDRLYCDKSGAPTKRWVDSTPQNTLGAVGLATMFPKSSFVHVLRDGREVVASMLRSGFAHPWASDFESASHAWVEHVEAARQALAILGDRAFQIRHEKLVREPERTAADLLSFLEEPPCAATDEFLRTRRINSSFPERYTSTGAAVRSREPAVWSEWTAQERELFNRIAGAVMSAVGYERE